MGHSCDLIRQATGAHSPGDILLVLDELIAHRLLGVSSQVAELRRSVDDVAGEVKAIEIIARDHMKGSGRRPPLLVAAEMDVLVIGTPAG